MQWPLVAQPFVQRVLQLINEKNALDFSRVLDSVLLSYYNSYRKAKGQVGPRALTQAG